MLPQDTMHLIQRLRYQRGSLCQDPAGNRTTRRPPDHHKETQTEEIWSCLPFIRSCQNHLARHSEREKKTRQWRTEKKQRKLVVKSSVVPQWPPRLRDRWMVKEIPTHNWVGRTLFKQILYSQGSIPLGTVQTVKLFFYLVVVVMYLLFFCFVLFLAGGTGWGTWFSYPLSPIIFAFTFGASSFLLY